MQRLAVALLTSLLSAQSLHDLVKTCDLSRLTGIAVHPALDQQDGRGNTPLHVAAEAGQRDCVQLLLRAGADRHIRNKDGKTAYQLAELIPNEKQKAGVTQLLLSHSESPRFSLVLLDDAVARG